MTKKSIPNQKRIEMLSINYLKNQLLKSDRIEPRILEGDKEPSWDGSILLYKTNDFKKDDLIKIPVQVKGHFEKDDFKGNIIKETLFKRDLINYRNHNGVFYIVIHTRGLNNCKVYYNDLLPSDINNILDEMEDNNTRKVKFKYFNMENSSSIETILINFHKNRLEHCPNDVYIDNPEKFDEIIMKFTYFEDTFKETLFNSKPIYGKINQIPNKLIPLSRVVVSSVSYPIQQEVKVSGKVYYDEINYVVNKENSKIKIGKSVEIVFSKKMINNNNMKININLNGSFKKRYKDSKFIQALFAKKRFKLNNNKIDLDTDFQLTQEIIKEIKYLDDINSLYDLLGIKVDLDIESLTDEDDKKLFFLIQHFVYKRKNVFTAEGNGLVKMNIANLSFLFLSNKIDDDNVNLLNIFNPELKLKVGFKFDNDKIEKHSFFLSLKREELSKLCNIDTELLCDEILEKKSDYSEQYFDYLRFFLLEAIHAYDLTKKEFLYNICKKINGFLLKNTNNMILDEINKYQLVERERGLSKSELIRIDRLIEKFKKNKNSNDILCALFILKKNKIDAKYYFEMLDEKKKEKFRDYPIYNLFTK